MGVNAAASQASFAGAWSGAGGAVPEPSSPASSQRPLRALIVGAGAGLEVCHSFGCGDDTRSVGVGPAFHAEVGFRPLWLLELTVEGTYGLHPVSYKTGSASLEGTNWNWAAAGGVRLRPLDLHTAQGFVAGLDPWVGVLAGFHWYFESATDSSSPIHLGSERMLRRMLVKFQAGVDYWLNTSMTLGVLFSYDRQFLGTECSHTGDNADKCTPINTPTLHDPYNALSPSEYPQYLRVELAYRLYL
jgi:hypothetical protein